MKLRRLYIWLMIALVSSLLTQCKKTNWNENFKEKSKSPFGTYIVYNEFEELFDYKKNHLIDQNIYDYLTITFFEEDYNFNYVCIKNSASKITDDGVEQLLYYIEQGSNAFFSLNYFNSALKDALEVETINLDQLSYSISHLKNLKGNLTLENKDFDETTFSFDRNLRRNYFSSFNKKNTVVLGTQNIDGKERPVFIKIYHGKGTIYLHTQPIAFTNYNMLNKNHAYAENVLSYLPDEETLWDSQIKWSRIDNSGEDDKGNAKSVFVFFLNNEPLKWFLYLGLFGLLIFLLFNARRKQRAIPVILPPKNSTLEFTHTISNLYLKNENHKSLVDKKILFFLEKIRTRYLIDTNNLNKSFIEKLASKSGNNLHNTKYLINTILALNKKEECSEEDLMVLNKMIDNFLKRK
ncbi:hypothetical protein AAON49_08080 [Pseudotenacibaculum sp. MALMAid0570]|uniref:hypothetical protein n=1 Tax=Pseudotenacibaculum sp. MALMAid0570 TaxID=3143938 RepID=UPI0032DE6832